ncbi:MAG: hypothetical protein LBJ64_06960 [Deltaproteobacteria bacterium]|jgi:hypothetical protein|nr:hypothetical protein [Deltaproteobacteria bacterium]
MQIGNSRHYLEYCLSWAEERLRDYQSPAEVAEAIEDINAYPGLDKLKDPQSIRFLSETDGQTGIGRRSVLEGRVLWEHPAAGEGTRLGLGPKYFITPEVLAQRQEDQARWRKLLPISLGRRHLFQLVYEIKTLAEEAGFDPKKVLSRQTFLVIGAEDFISRLSADVNTALRAHVPQENVWFMGQAAFPGLDREPGGGPWRFDQNSPKRLHNHGHMAMQKAMDEQIFRKDWDGRPSHLHRGEFFSRLGEFENLISSNIEDLDYLHGALDLSALGLAARLAHSDFGLLMEITKNNQERPVKGGMCVHDPALGRDVVIESLRLRGIQPRDIKYINKNINHFPRPKNAMTRLKENGLFMNAAVFDDKVYFLPVQGDINFLVKTAYFIRSDARQLNSLKTAADIPAALEAMEIQDGQPGFQELAAKSGLF